MRFQDVTIVGAITLNIRHALLGIKGASISDIKTVYSHPQGFSQCKNFLDAHPDWIHIDAISTASAAQIVEAKKDKSIAAIASTVNSGIYNLDVLQEDIENDPSNFTRFVIIQSRANADGKTGEVNIRPNMASIIFKTKNEVGALYKTLGIFNQHKINLTRLESRPLEGQPWNYWFYVDTSLENINGSPKEYVAAVIDALKNEVEDVRLLGVYPENRH